MTRAERLKRNYAILRNITGDSKLSNRAKHWSEEKIYNELNIYVGDYIKTNKTKLKPYTNNYRNRLLKSADNKYKYAVKHGVSEENAEIIKYQTYKVIDLQIKYQMFFKSKHKRFTKTEKELRSKEWKAWSEEDIYPPMLVHQARQINLKNNLDINDSYGFGIMFYYFTTNKSIEALQEQFKVDKNTGRIIYETVQRQR
ncbi:MAG: hypothetical protein QXI16_02680 [Sulfolobaceae archaeon]